MGHSPSDRDRLADERDRQADKRDRDADERDRQADQRDRQADQRDRQAQDHDETSGADSVDALAEVVDDGRFGVDLGGNEPTVAPEPDVAVESPPVSRPGRSLTERLADAADDRQRATSPSEDDFPESD
jgi:hypothetical protein